MLVNLFCVQEEKEEVRLMNQMVLHSKCMAARDQQVGEKQSLKRAAAEEEKLVVKEMEERRKAAVQALEVCGLGWARQQQGS